MSDNHSIVFRLSISPDDYLAYYQGTARDVVARAEDGRRVRFPASALQRFVGHEGIHGRFELRFDADRKFRGLRRLGD